MKVASVQVAVKEARAFISQAEQVLRTNKGWSVDSSKHSGALRRQSMELTRALAEMRKA